MGFWHVSWMLIGRSGVAFVLIICLEALNILFFDVWSSLSASVDPQRSETLLKPPSVCWVIQPCFKMIWINSLLAQYWSLLKGWLPIDHCGGDLWRYWHTEGHALDATNVLRNTLAWMAAGQLALLYLVWYKDWKWGKDVYSFKSPYSVTKRLEAEMNQKRFLQTQMQVFKFTVWL